jgi:medium-chain acyl-[acyl-carrier-protein] hydrolase
MKDVSERIAALPPDKRAQFLQRLKQKADQAAVRTLPAKVPSEEGWIVRYRPNEQARLRLFCFPYAGGGAAVFRQWSDALPSQVEVCGIQFPGREYRIGEPAYKQMPLLVEALTRAIVPYLDRPFAFYGHSMGALVCFTLARHLRKMQQKYPARLYLAAYRAVHLKNPNIKIYHLPTEVFKVVLRADGVPEMILQNEELMQAMMPTLRADYELCDTYEYQEEAPLECPMMIYGGLEDIRVGASDLEAWRLHAGGTFKLSMFPGPHLFLHSVQDLLLAELSQDLEEYLDSTARGGLVPMQSKSQCSMT